MIALVAKLAVKEGMQKEFEELMLALAKEVRANEPGNLLYLVTAKSGAPTEFYILEQYKDADALAAHGQSAHFRAASPKMAPFLDGRPEITRLDVRG